MSAEENKTAPAKAKMPFIVRFAIFMVFVTAVIFLPTTIVWSICMLPTLVAAVVDNHPQKTAWLTVGAMNAAGTVPAWFSMLDSGTYSMLDASHAVPAAIQLIIQPMTMIVAYGGAAFGWLIYYKVTPLVAAVMQGKNEHRLREIDKRQKFLVKKWGEGVILK